MDTRLDRRSLAAARVDWDTVYHEQLPRVYNFFRYRVGDDALAEDLTAATFTRAWRYRERYSRDLGAFSTWLLTIARHVAADHFRQRRAEVSLDAAPEVAAPGSLEDALQQQAELDRLTVLLGRLSGRDRELIALKYGAGLTNRAISALTGLSESNVGTALHRIIGRLRREWESPA